MALSLDDIRYSDNIDFHSLLELVYPVGRVIHSKQEINPAETYGGTWSYDASYHMLNGWYIYTRTA